MNTNVKEILKIHVILRWLQWIFIGVFIFTLIVLAIYLCRVFCHCNSLPEYCERIFSWDFLKQLLIACVSLITLFVAGVQLKKHTDRTCIDSLIELRKQLTTHSNRNVHFALLYEDEKYTLAKTIITDKPSYKATDLKSYDEIPMVDVFNYLGTIGMGIQMVKRELIDIETFYYHIGYRVENIFEGTGKAHDAIREHINKDGSYYPNLYWIYGKIQEWKIKKK
jgi:hypothetical protein